MGDKLGPGRPRQPPGAHHIDLPELVDLGLLSLVKQQRHPRKHRGAVHHRVDAAEVGHGSVDPGLGSCRIAGLIGVQLYVRPIQRRTQQIRGPAHPQAEPVPMGQQPLGNRSANAATGASDQDRAGHGAGAQSLRSKRSAFITLTQAATKSLTRRPAPSLWA